MASAYVLIASYDCIVLTKRCGIVYSHVAVHHLLRFTYLYLMLGRAFTSHSTNRICQ